MPAKRGKSGAGRDAPGGAASANKNWESGLTTAPFEEDSWKACVSVVVGERPEDEALMPALRLAVQQPLRKLFSFLSWESTLAKIQELGNPKVKKPKDLPMFYEVMEAAKVLLDAEEELPCELVAKILKFQLLEIKASDQQRRRAEQGTAVVKGKDKAGPASAGKDKAASKADKAKKATVSGVVASVEKEKESKLKRRGEVEPPTFIDDEPDDGPQHYVLIGGFQRPQLLPALDGVGVHVANVLMLGSERTLAPGAEEEQHTPEGRQQSPGDGEMALGEELARLARQQDRFWAGLGPVLDGAPPASRLHDVARLSHTVPGPLWALHAQDPQDKLALGGRIFEGVACLLYTCLDWRRQHQHYRDNTTLIHVPTVVKRERLPTEVCQSYQSPLPMTPGTKKKFVREDSPPATSQETEPPPLTTDVDMRCYNDLLDQVPPEACSVPLILHCMLEQVESTVQQLSLSLFQSTTDPRPVGPEATTDPRPVGPEATTDPRPAGPEATTDPRPAGPEATTDPRPAGPEATTDPRPAGPGPGMDRPLASYMLHSLLPLVDTPGDRSHMVDSLLSLIRHQQDRKTLVAEFGGELQRETERPLVYKHHDERALRLRQTTACQGFDPVEAEASMMKLCPVWELIHSVAPQGSSAPHRMALTQQLLQYCTDDSVPRSEVERVLRQSVFESMSLTGPDRQGLLLNPTKPQGTTPQPRVIPWDDPVSYTKQLQHKRNTDQSQTFLTEEPGIHKADRSVCTKLELSEIQRNRLRCLSDWNYAEHHNATVFPQVLLSASQAYRCMDTFRGSHDNILYVICHHPMSPQRQCKEFWDTALHTDVGFRNYLEHVADSISDWTREEEAKREAEQLRNLTTLESPPKDDESRTEPATPEPFIRNDSLKAWKLEQDRLREEDLTKKSKRDVTGGRKTPQGKVERAGSTKNKKDKKKKALPSRQKSREDMGSPAKSPTESTTTTTTVPPVEEAGELQSAAKPFTGFSGYSMDGRLIQVSGQLQSLFPSDGGHITVENISFTHGSRLMTVSLRKDGHHFYSHSHHSHHSHHKQPSRDGRVSTEKTVRQGSFTALLDNGVHLSYSYYGPTGQDTVSPQVSEGDAPGITSPSSSLSNHCPQGPGQASPPPTHTHNQQPASHTQPAQTIRSCHPFNGLNLSVPSGLLLQFITADAPGVCPEERSVCLRQSFPLHGGESAWGLPDPSLSKELSRVVTSNGAVVKYMRDGSTEVLFADGSVSTSPDSGPVWVPDSEVEEDASPEPKDGLDNKSGKGPRKEAELGSVPPQQRGIWVTTAPSGARVATVGNTHKHTPTDPVLVFPSTDPVTKAVMITREDKVVSIVEPDGTITVDHADGTRITSIYQEREPQQSDSLRHTGDWPDSTCMDSTSRCVSESMESDCASHRAPSLCSVPRGQSACESGREGVCGAESGREGVCGAESGREGVCGAESAVSVCDDRATDGTRSECVSDMGTSSVSTPSAEESAREGAEESAREGAEESAREGAEESAREGAEESAHEGAEESAREGAEESAREGAEESAREGAEESAREGAEESAREGAEESARDGGMAGARPKEWVVMVEKEGCATVVMYPERRTAHVFLADGTVVTATGHGAYQVFTSSEGLLQIKRDGTCMYSSNPGHTPSPTLTSDPTLTPSTEGGASGGQPGSYVMSHTAEVACEVIDPDGNHFQVMADGQTSVSISSPAENTWQQEEEEEEEDGEVTGFRAKRREHCPRLFLVFDDGSGTELLNSQTVEDLLYQTYSDPAVANLREPLSDTHSVYGITNLKPCPQSVWSRWLLGKQNPDIIPTNLKNRSWHDFPRVERKMPGPPFGSDLGVGLTLRPSRSPAHHRPPVLSCPEALELRELVQYQPVTSRLRTRLDTRLKEFMECLLRREELSEEVKVKDPRTEEERVHASDLLRLVLCLPEEGPAQAFDQRTAVEIARLYNKATRAPILQSEVSEDTGTTGSSSYIMQESQWTRRIAQHRQELSEDKACREALRNRNIVPYFHPENTQLHQALLSYQAPDMSSLSADLPPVPKTADREAVLRDAPRETTQRPLNPTPSHAAGSDAMPVARPTNPTPQTAGHSSLRWSSGLSKSVQLDVTGSPRKTGIKLPTSILSSKPDSTPNQQFLSVEEPVRRKCRTLSLIGPNPIVRGFQLLPSSVDFRTLREGSSYSVTVVMKNVGVDTCRFTIKQPPPATGLRVLYNPGPVPAGLQAELHVQLFAMSVVQEDGSEPQNYISQHIHIHTETDILYLPITATILPMDLYDVWVKDRTKRQNTGGSRVRLVPSTPPVRRGVVLPHRRSLITPADTGQTQSQQ